ncbi:MAG: metallophosphoesterase [Syntrophorhabdaceae bacterium]|nr:metallophosphoesterase [Syntrophorhabdaceae bacterium]
MKKLLFVFILFFILSCYAWAELNTFVIISDTHVGSADSVYDEFISTIEKQNINVIMHAGDAIHNPGKKSEWKKFFEITGNDRKVYIAPGNHDINDVRSMKIFLNFFSEPYYSFADNDTLFIFLNTELPHEKGKITGEQLEWLKKELLRDFKLKFVFIHRPLFPIFAGHGLDRSKKERDELHRIFEKNGVSLVISGHDHLYNRSLKDGITYIICAGAGGQNHFPAFNNAKYYFRYILAKRVEKGYTFLVKDLSGDTGDEFQIIKEK